MMPQELEEEMRTVCNLGEAIARRSREEGIAQGMAQGIAQGIAQGMAQGIAQGIAQGMAQGIAQGKSQGMKQAAQLMAKLFSMGRTAEAEKASNDAAYMQKLLKEYEFAET